MLTTTFLFFTNFYFVFLGFFSTEIWKFRKMEKSFVRKISVFLLVSIMLRK